MTAYANALPTGTSLYAGDYLTSPDGLYYAFVDTAGAAGYGPGLVVVAPGTNPTLAPVQNCLGCSVPISTTPSQNLGGFFATMGNNGSVTVYSSASGQNQGTVVPVSSVGLPQTPSNPPYYGTIVDTPSNGNSGGSFVIYQGTYPNTSNPTSLDNQNILGSVKSITLTGGASGTGIDYDLANAKITKTTPIQSVGNQQTNYTAQSQQYDLTMSLIYTKSSTYSFNMTKTNGETIGSSVNIGVPGLGGASLNFAINSSTSISKGQASTTSQSINYTAGERATVPPGYTYVGYVTGVDVMFDVPFSWSGIATYDSGVQAAVQGTGVLSGEDAGEFNTLIYCEYAPVGQPACPALPIIQEPSTQIAAPEPGTALILPMALLAMVLVRRCRGRLWFARGAA